MMLNLFNKPNLPPKRAGWFVTINDFALDIEHTEGKSNLVADTLGRSIAQEGHYVCMLEENCVDWKEPLVIKEQDLDPFCTKLKQFLRSQLDTTKYKLPVAGLALCGDLLFRSLC